MEAVSERTVGCYSVHRLRLEDYGPAMSIPESDPGEFDSEPFREFERSGWSEVASRYQATFGVITRQAVDPLLDAARIGAGDRVLDIACGPGVVAGPVLARRARVVGVDLSPSMAAEAQRLHPAGQFEVGDAESLRFDDGEFDAVVCGFGVLHFPRPEVAMREIRRVSKPGARFAASAWCPPEQSPYLALVRDAVAAHGQPNPPLPAGPPPYQFGEPARARALLEEAGFAECACREIPVIVSLTSESEVLVPLLEGGVRSRKLLEAQTPGALLAIEAHAAEAARAFRLGDRIEIPRPALVMSGRRS